MKPIELPPGVKISIYPEREKGGQQIGLTSTGVKVEYEDRGLTVIVDVARSQHKNKEIAIDMLLAGLTHPYMPN